MSKKVSYQKNSANKNMKENNIKAKEAKKEKSKIISKIENMSLEKYFSIIAIILIAIYAFSITPKTLQNDTYYTIKIGEHITKSGIDMKDPFSWHEDLDYTYPHWLYDYITYQVYNIASMDGVYIMTCALSILLGITIYISNSKISKNKVIPLIVTLIALYFLKPYIAARAQLVTFILFMLQILFIEKYLKSKKKRYGVGLVILPILIANLHLAVFPFYFVIFLPYIAQYLFINFTNVILFRTFEKKALEVKIKALEISLESPKIVDGQKAKMQMLLKDYKSKYDKLKDSIMKRKVRRDDELKKAYKIKIENNKNVKGLIVIAIIAAFTGFLTPLGTTPYTYLVYTMQGNTTQNINEHAPMILANEVAFAAVVALIIGMLMVTKVKIRLADLFMIGGMIILTFISRRQITMFAIFGSVIVARILIDLIKEIYSDRADKLYEKLQNIVPAIIITVIVLVCSYNSYSEIKDTNYVSKSIYPVDASEYILKNIDLDTAKFYNEYNYGSYMLYKDIPVFVDSRADLYAPEFSGLEDDIFSDFLDISGIGKFYEDMFSKYEITHVIAYSNSKLSMIIDKTNDPNYIQMYKDDYFVIYERLSNEV